MKKNLLFLTVASLFAFAGCEKEKTPSGEPTSVDRIFSVSEGHQVRFAPGNLEYDSCYHFTSNQYDYGGYFGWGTGSNPTLTSTNKEYYLTFDDWGSHIDGNWRTLSHDEWSYLIYGRENASDKRGSATVCDVHGMVLLPDNWTGGTFNAGMSDWNKNVYDASSWSAMETAGAVFLPAAGSRDGMEMNNVGTSGDYWSCTSYGDGDVYADYVGFHGDSVYVDLYCNRTYGISVRLVQDK